MFDKMANGWLLARQSLQVLKLDKELLLFPLLSGLACLIVLASFVFPLWMSGQIEAWANEGDAANNPLVYVVSFAFYFVNYFVIIFFNSALVACAVIRFKGGNPTLVDGLSAAANRLPQIAGWALVSATVGLLLRIIAERSGKLGEIISAILGTAWSVGTYFVVPVLVVERANPIEAFKRSLAILRQAWGEALTAHFGIGFFVFLANVIALIPAIIGLVSGNGAAMVIGIATSTVAILLISLVSSALNAIVTGALYIYAADGHAPEYFDEQTLAGAFQHK